MKRSGSETAVILADGSFPEHEIPRGYLNNAKHLICCDGSAAGLIERDIIPEAIVGDLDSLSDEIADKFNARLFKDTDQETNDLTKAVRYCIRKNYKDITILGATGKREDHTLGNISLLAEYIRDVSVRMVTDSGIFIPCLGSLSFVSHSGQQVSIFSIDPETEITSEGLRYPLVRRKLKNWWEATLNEAPGDSFRLDFKNGRVLVFLKFAGQDD
jgi:thiamine pyrophosphokinase